MEDNSMQILKYLIIGVGAIFAVLVIAFLALRKKMLGTNTRYIAELTKGTKESSFSMEIFYQKFYNENPTQFEWDFRLLTNPPKIRWV